MANSKTLKIGLFGFGHLGKIHYKCLQETSFEIAGVYDPNVTSMEMKKYPEIQFALSEDELISKADAVDIVSTTKSHFNLARKSITAGKHVFVEKPITSTLFEAKLLKKMLSDTGLVGQVGHVERYNPAFLAVKEKLKAPKFIEAHRLSQLNPRGNDVSVIMDLMIHDLDLVLDLVDSEVEKVSANGVSIVNATPDIGNARITFKNGCVANITASRVSMKQMRKIRLFQEDAYVSIDFLEKDLQIINLESAQENDDQDESLYIDTFQGRKKLVIHSPVVKPNNAIILELAEFFNCIMNNKEPRVTFEAGYESVKLAVRIEKEMDKNLKKVRKKSGGKQ